jgi:hypothetical protein
MAVCVGEVVSLLLVHWDADDTGAFTLLPPLVPSGRHVCWGLFDGPIVVVEDHDTGDEDGQPNRSAAHQLR